MKQTKTFCSLLCGFLLFSAITFGANRNSEIQGVWTSCNPMLRHGNMLVYAFPVTELDFTGLGTLFIEQKNSSGGTVSLYAYAYDGEELTLGNRYDNQIQYGKGTASIELREVLPEKVLTVQGFDDALLPNGTYYSVGDFYHLWESYM